MIEMVNRMRIHLRLMAGVEESTALLPVATTKLGR